MFKPYYKFIDKETKEIFYIRSTKSALKTIKKSLDNYYVRYVHSKGHYPTLIYFDKTLFIDFFSKSQLKYCHCLFKDDNIKFMYSYDNFNSKSISKYQYRQKIIKNIKRFNLFEEKQQANEIRNKAKLDQAMYLSIDSDSNYSLNDFIYFAIKDFKNKGAILKNESIVYLQE